MPTKRQILNGQLKTDLDGLSLLSLKNGWKDYNLNEQISTEGPRVLNKHYHGIPSGSIYCGRGSPYGNPYQIGKDGDRDEVCDKFEKNILSGLDVSSLRGFNLVCFCAPKRCHCDPILIKANK